MAFSKDRECVQWGVKAGSFLGLEHTILAGIMSFSQQFQRAGFLGAAALLVFSLVFGQSLIPAQGHGHHQPVPVDYRLGDLVITAAWSPATPANAPVAAGFLRITNHGSNPDRLISALIEGVGEVEIHETSHQDGVARMRKLEPGLVIAPASTVELKPGGYHLMFMRLAKGFVAGEKRLATLVFERAGKIDIEFAILPIGAAGHAAHPAH